QPQRHSLERRGRWCCAGPPPGCSTPSDPSAASRATSKCPSSWRRYTDTPTPTPNLSVPSPKIHRGSSPKIHATRDMLDVGGEPDAPIKFENKQYEAWEENTYVLCEVLGWRGIWHTEERRRIGNVDVGRTIYLGLPYYGRWVLAAARILVEKHHITLGDLTD